jgi:hypothetical protein
VHQVHEPSGDPLFSESTLDDVFEKGRELMDTEATPPWQQTRPPHATTLRQRFAPPRCPPSGPRIASVRGRRDPVTTERAAQPIYVFDHSDASTACCNAEALRGTTRRSPRRHTATQQHQPELAFGPSMPLSTLHVASDHTGLGRPDYHTRRPRCVDAFDMRRVLHDGQRTIVKAARAERHAAERGFGPVRDELGHAWFGALYRKSLLNEV